MNHHVLTINSQTFVLLDGEHAERIRQAVLDAVARGGRFLELPTGMRRTVEVLVTPASSVTIEHLARDGDPGEPDDTFEEQWATDSDGIDYI